MLSSGANLPDTQDVTGTACSPLTARSFSNILTHRTLAASAMRWDRLAGSDGVETQLAQKRTPTDFTIWKVTK